MYRYNWWWLIIFPFFFCFVSFVHNLYFFALRMINCKMRAANSNVSPKNWLKKKKTEIFVANPNWRKKEQQMKRIYIYFKFEITIATKLWTYFFLANIHEIMEEYSQQHTFTKITHSERKINKHPPMGQFLSQKMNNMASWNIYGIRLSIKWNVLIFTLDCFYLEKKAGRLFKQIYFYLMEF